MPKRRKRRSPWKLHAQHPAAHSRDLQHFFYSCVAATIEVLFVCCQGLEFGGVQHSQNKVQIRSPKIRDNIRPEAKLRPPRCCSLRRPTGARLPLVRDEAASDEVCSVEIFQINKLGRQPLLASERLADRNQKLFSRINTKQVFCDC